MQKSKVNVTTENTDNSSVEACDLPKTAELKRLENVFSSSIKTLQLAHANQTSKILEAIGNIQVARSIKHAITSPDKSSVTIHQLEEKIRSLKTEKQSIEFKLQLEKSSILLKDQQQAELLKHEQESLKDTREQLRAAISNATYTQETSDKKLKEKNEEIDSLKSEVG